jgi:hypothetical protein
MMNNRLKYLLGFLLCINSLSSLGQKIDSVLYSQVIALKTRNIDPIITFSLPIYGYWSDDTLTGIGSVTVYEHGYLLYETNGKMFAVKCVGASDEEKHINGYFKSKALEIRNDSLFRWIKASMREVEDEYTQPCICKSKTRDSIDVYSLVMKTDAPIYYMNIYDSDRVYGKTIDPKDFAERPYYGGPLNLNYKFNIQTKTYALYMKLEGYLNSIDRSFTFSKQ